MPKILIKCGHTVCSDCIERQVERIVGKTETGECPECHTLFPVAIVQEFPVNLALLQFT